MANKLDAKQLIVNLDKTAKELAEVNKQLKISVDLQLQLQKGFNNQSKSQADVVNKSKAVQTSTQKNNELAKDRIKLINNLNKANSDAIQKNVELRVQIQKQNKANKDLAREKLGLVGAYERESKKLNELRKRYKDLIVAGKGNEKATKALGKQVEALDKKLKKADGSAGQFQRNVGNYPGAMGRAQSSIMGVSQAFKALLANPVVAVVAAIAGAFIGLVKALKRSEEGQNALNKISAVFGATLDVLLDIVTDLAEKLLKAFQDPQQAVADLWEAIKKNLVNRLTGLVDVFVKVGQGLKALFQRDIPALKEAAKEAGQALIQMTTGLDPEQQKKIAKGIQEVTKEIALEADITAKLADRQARLDKQIRENLVFQQKTRAEINTLRETAAKKEEVSAEERLRALDEAIRLENELEAINVRITEEKFRIKEAQNALGASTKADLDEQAQLEADLFAAQALAAKKRKALEAERVTTLREIAVEEQAIIDAGIDADIAAADESINILKEQLDEEFDLKVEASKKEIELARETEELKKEIKSEALDAFETIASERFAAGIDNQLNSFRESQEAEEQILKDKLDKGKISEEQYEKEIKAIRLKTRQEEAKANKKQALFDIAIATAVAIAKSLPDITGTLIAKTLLISGLQAAAVAARPIPKFKQGGEMKTDGLARFSEEGSELAVLPGGQALLTPQKESVGFIPKGTTFFSHHSPETQAALNGGMSPEKFDMMINEQRATRKAITKQKGQASWTRKGLKIRDERRKTDTTYIDKYLT